MATITITGDEKHISNIVRENRIRVRRKLIEISGDVEDPRKKLAEAAKNKDKKGKKGKKGKGKGKPEAKKDPEEGKKDDGGETGTKEEKPEIKTKEEKDGPNQDKEDGESSKETAIKKRPVAKKAAKKN